MKKIILFLLVAQFYCSCAQENEIVPFMENYYGELKLPSEISEMEYTFETRDENYEQRYKYINIKNIDILEGILHQESNGENSTIEVNGNDVKYYINHVKVQGIEDDESEPMRENMKFRLQTYQTLLFAPNYIKENSKYFNYVGNDTLHDLGELLVYSCSKWPDKLRFSDNEIIKFYFKEDGQLVSIKETDSEGKGIAFYMIGHKIYNGNKLPELTSIFTLDAQGKRSKRIEQQTYDFGHNFFESGPSNFNKF